MYLKMKFAEFRSSNPWAPVWLIAVLVSGFLAYYLDQHSGRDQVSSDSQTADAIESASTYIPDGYVLVPIEVANFESLDSILGKFGVVDLYVPPDESRKKPIKIAERIKILRAPLNPSRFAVLAPESESSRLVSFNGPLNVVVQNPKKGGTRFVNGSDKESESSRSTHGQRRRTRILVEMPYAETD